MMVERALMPTYKRLPVAFNRGEGAWLWDTDGEAYLDALSGIAVCGLGHAHPAVATAVAEQAASLVHTSNLYGVPIQEELARRLIALSGMDNVFFCNSGAEANEAAIKVARAYGSGRGVELPRIVVMDGSFHGRTLATLSATGNRKVHAGFEPLVQGFVRVRFNDLAAVEQVAQQQPGIAAILVEPILGEGGVVVPDDDYLQGLRAICDRHQWLLMLDEIQTGMGRTGRWFAHQHHDLKPDVMTLAKSLGNGVPIGACLTRGAAASTLGAGSHGSTFGGNPLACRAALAVLDAMEQGDLVGAAETQGAKLIAALRKGLAGVNCVKDIRGQGLMIGVELEHGCAELVQRALDKHVLINVTADKVVRLLPPLIINEDELQRIADTVVDAVREWNSG